MLGSVTVHVTFTVDIRFNAKVMVTCTVKLTPKANVILKTTDNVNVIVIVNVNDKLGQRYVGACQASICNDRIC